jgi:murein DD-endopeptidase MepM/ murein hydrolase activator NlpD
VRVSSLILACTLLAMSCAPATQASPLPEAVSPVPGADAQVAATAAGADRRGGKAETARLDGPLDRAEEAYAQLAGELAGRSGLGAFTGRFANWPVTGRISSPFGPRWGGFHNGLDIAVPMFTPVRAAAAGQVVTVGRSLMVYGDTGMMVIVAHGSNVATLYTHLDDSRLPPVTVGQVIQAGTVIGFVGLTGWTTGPHVHFTAIVGGRAVDPIPYLP